MSSGYSVGDFVAGAGMAQKLYILVKASADAPSEYEAAMKELVVTQQAFITVSQLSQNQVFLPRDTINSASFLISSSLDTISKFLKQTESLKKSLSGNGPPTIRDSGCRIGWEELYGKDELRELREKLHNCLAALNLLLSAANLYGLIPGHNYLDNWLTFVQWTSLYSPSIHPIARSDPRSK